MPSRSNDDDPGDAVGGGFIVVEQRGDGGGQVGVAARRRGEQRMARRVVEDGQRAAAEDFAGSANTSTRHQDVAEHGLLVTIDIHRKGQQIDTQRVPAIGVPEAGGPLGQHRGQGIRGGGPCQECHEPLDRAVPVGAGAPGQERE